MSQPEPPFRRLARTPTIWIVGATVLFFGLLSILNRPETGKTIRLSDFLDLVDDGKVKDATILDGDQQIRGTLDDGTEYVVSYPTESADEITTQLQEAGVSTEAKPQTVTVEPGSFTAITVSVDTGIR